MGQTERKIQLLIYIVWIVLFVAACSVVLIKKSDNVNINSDGRITIDSVDVNLQKEGNAKLRKK